MRSVALVALLGCSPDMAAFDHDVKAERIGRPRVGGSGATWCRITAEDAGYRTSRLYRYDRHGRVVAATIEELPYHRGYHWARSEPAESETVRIYGWNERDGEVSESEPMVERFERGHIVGREQDSGVESWSWDDAGHVTSYQDSWGNFGRWELRWDDAGRVVSVEIHDPIYGSSGHRYCWDGDRYTGWSSWGRDAPTYEFAWTTHDADGRPVSGEGESVDYEGRVGRWTEAWTWDAQGRATSTVYRTDRGERRMDWAWGDRDVVMNGKNRIAWDDAGRVIEVEHPGDLAVFTWSDDGRLQSIRRVRDSGESVTRWGAGCPPSSWTESLPEIPAPGPFPVAPWLPGPTERGF